MSMMNTLSKGKFINPGINNYSNTKSKEVEVKNKKTFVNNEGIKTQVITLGTHSINPTKRIIPSSQCSDNPNSFRQTGILNMKFKTTKNSRNYYINP